MAQQQPDLQAILAALAASRSSATPSQPQQGQAPPAQLGGYQLPQGLPQGLPGYSLPQPVNSGNIDLSAIKPVSSGQMNINDALAKARNFAAEQGIQYDSNRNANTGRNPYQQGSNSPAQRDNFNPYRDERRDDARRAGYGRERSRSPRGGKFSPPNNGRSYGRERSPPRRENDDSEVISIDSSLVGLVIGRQGENLRRIEQDSGARIQFMTSADHPGPQRQCRVTGNPRARSEAIRAIFRIIEENNMSGGSGGGGGRAPDRGAANSRSQPQDDLAAMGEGENAMQIMVPDRTVGLVIGRGGETIRDLQERSGCHINIVAPNKSVNGLRPVNLIGSLEASQKAKDLIMEIVDSDTRGPGAQNDPSQMHQQSAPRNDYGQQQQQQQQSRDQGRSSKNIYVPSEAVGMIIGKGGETIKDMQTQSGCKINVTQPSGADVEREIQLIGTPQAMDHAERLILDKVDTVREKSGGGPRRQNDSYSQGGQQQYGQSSYGGSQQQPQQQQYGQSAPAAASTDASGADPYAAYGGYANYMALWYQALQNGPKPEGQQ